MSDEQYTPTDEDVRSVYCGQQPAPDRRYLGAEFDRFLAAHDARVRAEAHREVIDWAAGKWLSEHGVLYTRQHFGVTP